MRGSRQTPLMMAWVSSLSSRIGVKFVEVADTQGQVGVGKELHRFGFGQTHEEGVDVFLYRPFLQECGKGAGASSKRVLPSGRPTMMRLG